MHARELHPRSFFAFADRVKEATDYVSDHLDMGLALDQLPDAIPVTGELVSYAGEMEAGLHHVLTSTLVSVKSSDDGRLVADYRAHWMAARERRSTLSTGRGRRQGHRHDAALRRAKIAGGALLSLPTGTPRAAAADLLNRGIPTKDRTEGVDYDIVRNALTTLGGWIRPGAGVVSVCDDEFDRCAAVCMALKFDYLVLDAIWRRALDHFGSRNLNADRVRELIDSGRLWRWHLDAVEMVRVEPVRTDDALLLVKGYISALRDHLRYRQRHSARPAENLFVRG